MKNRVLVIIVTYNGMKWIDRCFGSLKESEEPVDVFVVDNGSTDGTVARIREICKGWFLETTSDGGGWWLVDLVETHENLGFGKANNLGLEYALDNGYQYVYLLNQDAWVNKDTFTALIGSFEKNPPYGVLSPIQTAADGNRLDPNFSSCCSKYLPDLKSHMPGLKDIYDVPFVMAAHWMISRPCLEAVGGFSPAFRHYGEDDNFLHRCRYHGFRAGVDIRTSAVHDRESRVMTKSRKMKLKSVGAIVRISNPRSLIVFRLLWEPLKLLGISIVHASSEAFADVFRLLASYPKLIRYRKASRGRGAFLGR